MIELNNFMINNFKIFKGERWFSFKDLNIFTGTNNSGKSTFLKLIYLINEGFAHSDFPKIDLTKCSDKGDFNDIVNKFSKEKEIGFGFEFKMKDLDEKLLVKYKFINDKEHEDFAQFSSLDVFSGNTSVFGIYREFDDNQFRKYFKSPLDGNNPGQLKFKLNIDFFDRNSPLISKTDFKQFFLYLKKVFKKEWWGEEFIEEEFYKEYNITLNDFGIVLAKDNNYNLGDYKLRKAILCNNGSLSKDQEYKIITNETKYQEFIREVVYPLLSAIKNQLFLITENFTSIKNISNIKINSSLVNLTNETEFLLQLVRIIKESPLKIEESQEFKITCGGFLPPSFWEFLFKSMSLFNFDYTLNINFNYNSGFIIDLLPIANKTVVKKNEASLYGDEELNGKIDYENKINISELGKGNQNLLLLILKVASVLFKGEIKRDNSRNFSRKIILIEEPEAFLHPDWQSKLADFFAYCLKRYKVQFFIETHSEYLILKLQNLTAKKKIKPEDSMIYYFHHPDNIPDGEEQVKKINIKEDGRLSGEFGSGFYDESSRLMISLFTDENLY